MNVKSALSSSTWLHLAREQWLQSYYQPLQAAPISWELNSHLLRSSEIIWPSSYTWPHADKWMNQIQKGLATHVTLRESNTRPLSCSEFIVPLTLKTNNKEILLAIDYSDYTDIDEEIAAKVSCYFKMQYRKEGYAQSSVIPGGFVCNDPAVYNYASALRDEKSENRFDLYGRFSVELGRDTRTRAINLLRAQNKFQFEGDLTRIRYSKFVEESYHSRLCLDLPGNGAFCFRLLDYFALGCAVISPTHKNRLHVPLIEGKHIVYCKEDLSDLVEVAANTLNDPMKLARLRKNCREYFDRYLHCEQLAAYYLYTCYSHL